MLQSPNFLFHVESGPDGRFADYAGASRLSYFLWDTMPDQSLLDAAAKGELRTTEGRDRWARRMIESPLARQSLDEFFNQWFRLEKVLSAAKDRRRYPDFTPELAAAMGEETRRLLQHVVWDNTPFMEFLTAGYGFLNTDLAALYKLPPSPGSSSWVRLSRRSRRRTAQESSPGRPTPDLIEPTHPAARGICSVITVEHVRRRSQRQHPCQTPPKTNFHRRQRLAAHVENAACAAPVDGPHRIRARGLDALATRAARRQSRLTAPIPTARLPRIRPAARDVRRSRGFPAPPSIGTLAVLAESRLPAMRRPPNFPLCERPSGNRRQETIQHLFARISRFRFHFKELLIALAAEPRR
jgi:hypothetical protein